MVDSVQCKALLGESANPVYNTVADFTGTIRGQMKGSDGKLIAPTNKKFHIEFCTVAHWKNAEIIEEKPFYDLVGLLKQIGGRRAVQPQQPQYAG